MKSRLEESKNVAHIFNFRSCFDGCAQIKGISSLCIRDFSQLTKRSGIPHSLLESFVYEKYEGQQAETALNIYRVSNACVGDVHRYDVAHP